MNKRSIHEFLTIVMRSFFDFDYAYFTHAATVFFLVPCILGFLVKNIADLFHDGLVTVKDDAHDIHGILVRNSYLLRHNKVVTLFHDGLLTVKDDAIEIRAQVNTYRKQLVSRYHRSGR